MAKITKEQKEEALAKVAEVLEQAMNEYEMLEKMDLELAEDPSRPMMAAPQEEPKEDDEDKKKKDEEEMEDESAEGKDEPEEDKEDSKEDMEDEDDMDDEAMKSEYAKICAKMEKRGLMNKSAEIKKSENVQAEPLSKAIDDRFESLNKAISEIAEKVNKIASQPAQRKGVNGLQPLKKTEDQEAQPLNKTETINKLLDLKKSGNKAIGTDLIMRVETGRYTEADIKQIKGFLS